MTSLRPLTLTNSITRKSSAAVSISSTSMMMFGCFTRRSIDTSFSIRCSCQMKSLERWIRNHRTLCSALHFGGQQCRSDAGRSNSLGRDGQTPVSLVATGTGQVSGTSHCHYQKETDVLQNIPGVVSPSHVSPHQLPTP